MIQVLGTEVSKGWDDPAKTIVRIECDKCNSIETNEDKDIGRVDFEKNLRLMGWTIGTKTTCPVCNASASLMEFRCNNCEKVIRPEHVRGTKQILSWITFGNKVRSLGWRIGKNSATCPSCQKLKGGYDLTCRSLKKTFETVVLKISLESVQSTKSIGEFELQEGSYIVIDLLNPDDCSTIISRAVRIGAGGGMYLE